MIYPIVAYGHPALREETQAISPDYPELEQLIADMYETMYAASGVGLAAPQIGLSIRLFIVDGSAMEPAEDQGEESLEGFKQIFINPEMLEESGDSWQFEEGCLSIPGLREPVSREPRIKLRYQDENFETYEREFFGVRARIIQHEYDHLEGVLFSDYTKGLRKRMIRGKLQKISKGKIDAGYPMRLSTGQIVDS